MLSCIISVETHINIRQNLRSGDVMFPTVENRPSEFSLNFFHRMLFPDHLHAQIEIALPFSGDFHAKVDGSTHVIHPGEALLVFPNHLHGYPQETESHGLMLIFSPGILPELGVDWETTQPRTPVITPLTEDTRYALSRLSQLPPTHQLSREISALLHLLLSGLLQNTALENASAHVVSDILYNALRYIAAQYASPDISLKTVARHVGVNEYHLSHLLNARLHTDFRRYVNLLRVDKARQMLTQKSLSVEEISFRCGFSTLRSFDRVFKEIAECTPREYRRQLCTPASINAPST